MTSQRALRERVLIAGVLIVLLWGMDWMYVHILVAIYGERGFPGYPFVQRGDGFRILCWSIGLVPMVWMPLGASRPSQVLVWFVFLMTVLPTAMIAPYATQPSGEAIAMVVALVVGLAILSLPWLLPPLQIPVPRLDPGLFWTVLVLISGTSYVLTVATFGTTIHFVALAQVYVQRATAFGVNAPLAVRYAMSWQETVINPFFMALGVARRRPLVFLAGLLGEVFLFGVAAQRVVLAVPFIVLGLHVLLRRGGARFGLRAATASAIAFVAPIVTTSFGGFAPTLVRLLFDALLNRLYLNTGFITTLYFKYFANHPHVGFAEVKPFNWFLRSPYPMHYTAALAWDVWGLDSDPNANLFADGFAQLGYAGLVIEAVGLAALFWLLDSIARQRKMSVWLVGMCCAAQVSSVVNAATSNILGSGGFGLILVLLACFPVSEARATPRPQRATKEPESSVVFA